MLQKLRHHGIAYFASRRRNVGRTLAVALALLGLPFATAQGAVQGEPGGDGGEVTYTGGGSFPFEGPAVLEPGSISFHYTDPGQPDLQFEASGIELAEFPGSLYLPETPLGPAGLLAGEGAGSPDYYVLFLNLGVVIPVSADASGVRFVGYIGTGTMTVNATPIQGPGGTLWFIARDKNGRVCIYFFSPCVGATFKQFFTKEITWKGTKNDPAGGPPIPDGGTWTGPDQGSGNGGGPVTTDGQHVYVDAPAGNGDYPNVLTTTSGSLMTDSPNIGNGKPVADDLEGSTANGRDVKEITVTWHFTLYVYCGGQITEKIQWSYSQTTKEPFGPTTPDGQFGGPVSTPTNQLDPQHDAALNGTGGGTSFAQGNRNGAPAPGGW